MKRLRGALNKCTSCSTGRQGAIIQMVGTFESKRWRLSSGSEQDMWVMAFCFLVNHCFFTKHEFKKLASLLFRLCASSLSILSSSESEQCTSILQIFSVSSRYLVEDCSSSSLISGILGDSFIVDFHFLCFLSSRAGSRSLQDLDREFQQHRTSQGPKPLWAL